MNKLSFEKRVQVLTALVEGCSIASTCRMTGVAKMTVLKLISDVGEACTELHDRWFRDIPAERVQCDEIWSFVGMKQKNVPEDKRNLFGYGDVWTFVAFDADTKLVLSWFVGARTTTSAVRFLTDLRSRTVGKFQLSTDGFDPYNLAVPTAFGQIVDYAQVVKKYAEPVKEDRRKYSPSKFISEEIEVRIGNPDLEHASTSYVERNNLSIRTFNRRMTRLTCAFSKKLENHANQLAINFVHANCCRINRSIRCTPAMMAGITSTVWDVADLVKFADEHEMMSNWDLRTFVPPHPHIA